MAARRFSIASLTRSCGWTSQLRQCVPRPAYAVPLPVTPLRSLLPFRQAVRNLSAAGGERPKHVWSTGASARASIEDLTNVTSGREADARVPTAAECVTAISDAMNAGVSPMKLVSNIAAQTTFVPISFDLANTCMNAAVMCKDFDVVLMLCDLYSKLQIVPDLSVSERAVATASAAKMHAVAVKLFEVMVKYGLDASQLACVQAAVSYAHIGKPEITVGLVRRLADDDAAVLTPSVLESLIDVLCVTGDIDKAFDVFLIAETRHVQLSGDVVGRLLALSSHDIERVKPVIEYSLKWSKMQDYAVKNIAANAMAALPETSHFDALISLIGKSSRPGDDVLLCNLLLTVFGKSGNFAGASKVWETMRDKAIVPSAGACASWMAALNRANKAFEALAIFDRMLANKMQPDKYVFSTLLKSCAKIRDYDRAKLYWRALQLNQGYRKGVLPNVACYNAMIQCSVGAAARSDAFNLLDQMRVKSVKPNDITFLSIILCCSQSGTPHLAFSVYDDMRVDGVAPTEAVFSALLQTATNARSADLLKETVGLMEQESFRYTEKVYGHLIHGFAHCEQAAEAVNWLKEMRRYFQPSLSMYSDAIGAVATAGNMKVVDELMALSKQDNVIDTGTLRGQWIRGLALSGQVEKAYEELLAYDASDVRDKLWHAYSAVIKCCTDQALLVKLFGLIEKAVSVRMPSHAQVFSELAEACARVKNAEMAESIITLIRKSHITPTNAVYNSILSACVSENRPDIAQRVVENMIASGLRPTPETFQILSQAKSADAFMGADSESASESTDVEEEIDVKHVAPRSKPAFNKGFGKKTKHLQQSFSAEVVRRRAPIAIAEVTPGDAVPLRATIEDVERDSDGDSGEEVEPETSSSEETEDDEKLPAKLTMFQQVSARPAPTAASQEDLMNKSKQELIKLPLVKLRDMAAAAKLKKSGNKTDLVERIVAHNFRRS